MTFHHWFLYVLVIVTLIGVPGPSAVLCLTHGARHGGRRAIATVAGGVLAALTLMLLSVLGVGALLAASATLFTAIKLLGALYLLYLGISAWRSSAPALSGVALDSGEIEVRPLRKLFGHGFMVGVGNPKDLLFFGALFPQFVDPHQAIVPQLLLLALTWVVADFSIMSSYALMGRRIAAFFTRLGGGRLFNRVTGGAFIAAGGVLALSSR